MDAMKAAETQGMNMKPPSGILRPRKFLNRIRKRANWQANHLERASICSARANDTTKEPNYVGKNPYHPQNAK
jgi:hypothetical protein